jgi:hypothetical protein
LACDFKVDDASITDWWAATRSNNAKRSRRGADLLTMRARVRKPRHNGVQSKLPGCKGVVQVSARLFAFVSRECRRRSETVRDEHRVHFALQEWASKGSCVIERAAGQALKLWASTHAEFVSRRAAELSLKVDDVGGFARDCARAARFAEPSRSGLRHAAGAQGRLCRVMQTQCRRCSECPALVISCIGKAQLFVCPTTLRSAPA